MTLCKQYFGCVLQKDAKRGREVSKQQTKSHLLQKAEQHLMRIRSPKAEATSPVTCDGRQHVRKWYNERGIVSLKCMHLLLSAKRRGVLITPIECSTVVHNSRAVIRVHENFVSLHTWAEVNQTDGREREPIVNITSSRSS
jgi:hypothetical protein